MDISQEAPASFRSSAVRPGALALVREGFSEIWGRRRLTRYLVLADLKKKGTDRVLGNVWWVLDPLLQMAVYVVLVTIILENPEPDYPLFVFAAILPWKWFQSTVNDSVSSVVSSERLIKQIHFPKIVLPVAGVVAGIANFLFGLIPLFGLMLLFYSDRLSLFVLLIPVVAVVQFIFSLALGLALSAINVFYRDVGNVMRHVLRLWFYLSPALYSLDRIARITDREPAIGLIMSLNPFAILFGSYRAVIYYEQFPDWRGLAALTMVSILLLVLTTYLFKRVEPLFAKVL